MAEFPPANTHPTHDDEMAILETLARCLLSYRGDEPVRLLPAHVTTLFPSEVPFPDGSKILGSFQDYAGRVAVVFDTELSPQPLFDFYRQRLLATGWQDLLRFMDPAISTPEAGAGRRQWAHFCRGEQGPGLDLTALQSEAGLTHVNLTWLPHDTYCAMPDLMKRSEFDTLMPALHAPPGSSPALPGTGNNLGNDHNMYQSEVAMHTTLAIADLADHFARQLAQAGWATAGSGQDGPIAFSAWTFEDDQGLPWHGWFIALDRKTTAQAFLLQLLIERTVDKDETTRVSVLETPRAPSSPAEDNTMLQALILRLLDFRSNSDGPQAPQLLLRQMSKKLPPEIALPEKSRVVGSFENRYGEPSVVFETGLPPEEVVAFYDQHLKQAGWSEPEPFYMGGFVPNHPPAGRRLDGQFCRSPQGPALFVGTRPSEHGQTQVTLQLLVRHPLCNQTMPNLGAGGLFPPLFAPTDSRLTWLGAGGGDMSYSAQAVLNTTLEIATVASHYEQQLERAGWAREESGRGSLFAGSAWTLRDEQGQPLHGWFIAAGSTTPSQRFLLQLWVFNDSRELSPLPFDRSSDVFRQLQHFQ